MAKPSKGAFLKHYYSMMISCEWEDYSNIPLFSTKTEHSGEPMIHVQCLVEHIKRNFSKMSSIKCSDINALFQSMDGYY